MSGAPDLLYVRARAALLDVAEALAEQLDAVVLVGAQAVYIHTGDANFVATAPYTTDADFCIAPAHLNNTPRVRPPRRLPTRYWYGTGIASPCQGKA